MRSLLTSKGVTPSEGGIEHLVEADNFNGVSTITQAQYTHLCRLTDDQTFLYDIPVTYIRHKAGMSTKAPPPPIFLLCPPHRDRRLELNHTLYAGRYQHFIWISMRGYA